MNERRIKTADETVCSFGSVINIKSLIHNYPSSIILTTINENNKNVNYSELFSLKRFRTEKFLKLQQCLMNGEIIAVSRFFGDLS